MQFNLKNIVFLGLPQKEITEKSIHDFMNDNDTKRIHFASSHAKALRKVENRKGGKIVLPFSDTINAIIQSEMGSDVALFQSKYGGVWRDIKTEKEYLDFEKFIREYNDIVFLRDNLDLSIALSMNFDENKHTEIGELEYQAKFNNNTEAQYKLINIIKEWIEKLPFYKYADYICAMPSSKPGKKSLPENIVASLSSFDFVDISEKIAWSSKKRSIKEAKSIEEKLEILEESNLVIADDLDVKGKTIILFDDLYMSGISMQYVAMKLKSVGAKRIFGLSMVKSRSNTAI